MKQKAVFCGCKAMPGPYGTPERVKILRLIELSQLAKVDLKLLSEVSGAQPRRTP